MNKNALNSQIFHNLSPHLVLDLVEEGLGCRFSNLFRPLNSYINRVFELETADGERMVAKFYRPGRWTKEAILQEHGFLFELEGKELPVAVPKLLQGKTTLGCRESMYFSVFNKFGGRSVDEFSQDQWLQLGRLLGRIHSIGAENTARARITMHPDHSTRAQLDFLLSCNCVAEDQKPQLERAATAIIGATSTLFAKTSLIRIHGDCHFSNVLSRPEGTLFLIDFDDMAMGPPVQDIWMLLPGGLEECLLEFDLFVEGYETFMPFDRRSLQLVEPLRAMRFIHFMAWCAHQVEEEGQTLAIDGFGTREYWQKEILDLEDQLQRIADFQMPF